MLLLLLVLVRCAVQKLRLRTLYVKYCENKPKADYIVSEYFETVFADAHSRVTEKLELNEQQRKLKMNDLIIKPVQRIMKYQLVCLTCAFTSISTCASTSNFTSTFTTLTTHSVHSLS